MRTRGLAGPMVLLAASVAGLVGPGRARAADPLCTGNYGQAAPRAGQPLRFGVDPGLAGSVGGVQTPSVADDVAKDVAATSALRPAGHVLVARLNRLFWSDGDAGITQFQALVSQYTRAGIDVELQVRYHPTNAENGDLGAWQAWVRHVVDVFGSNPRVVAMTITNEVNVTFSPNTSDGSYDNATQALIDGVEAAHAEAARRGYDQLRFGFTFAYRFSPQSDAAFFAYLGAHGGAAFRAALSFVGLDFYPGTIYPPVMAPGDSYRAELAQALGVMRDCLMPIGSIGTATPIWITENGVPTGADLSDAEQADALLALVQAAADYSGTFNVTDYRWFNLRDSDSTAAGSLPGVAATFATDGLLTDDYVPKPAFAAYRGAIAKLGALEPQPVPRRCRGAPLKLALIHAREPIRSATVYSGHRRLARVRGRSLRSVRLVHPPNHAVTVRIVLELRGGRRVTYRSRLVRHGCGLEPGPVHVSRPPVGEGYSRTSTSWTERGAPWRPALLVGVTSTR